MTKDTLCACGSSLMGEDGPAATERCLDCGAEICDRCSRGGHCTQEFGRGCAETREALDDFLQDWRSSR